MDYVYSSKEDKTEVIEQIKENYILTNKTIQKMNANIEMYKKASENKRIKKANFIDNFFDLNKKVNTSNQMEIFIKDY